jgi:hypothetical protein
MWRKKNAGSLFSFQTVFEKKDQSFSTLSQKYRNENIYKKFSNRKKSSNQARKLALQDVSIPDEVIVRLELQQ